MATDKEARDFSFESWVQSEVDDLWGLFSNFSSNENDFVELLLCVRREARKNRFFSSFDADRVFFDSWKKRFSIDSRDDLQFCFSFLIFSRSWSANRVSHAFREHLSRVWFVIGQGIRDANRSRQKKITKKKMEYSVVELYIAEIALERRASSSSPKLAELRKRIPDCEDSTALLKQAEQYVDDFYSKEVMPPPEVVKSAFRQGDSGAKLVFRKYFEPSRLNSRFLLGLTYGAVVVLIVLGVVSVPYFGDLRLKAPDYSQMKEEQTADAVIEEAQEWIDIEAIRKIPLRPWEGALYSVNVKPKPLESMIVEMANSRFAELQPKQESPSVAQKDLPKSEAKEPIALPAAADPKPSASPQDRPAVAARPSNVFLRWGAFSSRLNADASKIISWLRSMGVSSAGELELGADYRGGRYFHFEISEDLFPNFKSQVDTLGLEDFTDSQARSSRQSTPGKVRIVFLIRPR